MLGDVSVYHSSSALVNKQTDELAASLGFGFLFANLLITSKSFDLERQVALFVESVRKRDDTVALPQAKKSSCLNQIPSAAAQPSLRVFTRVTVALQHGDKLDVLCETLFKKIQNHPGIDCFCIRPAHEVQLLELINNHTRYMFDLLSLDLSNGNFFQQSGTLVKTLKSSQNLYLELELSQMQRGSNELVNLVSQAKLVFPRAAGAIIASGAKSAFELRSPLDLVNWAKNIMGIRGSEKRLDQLLQIIAKKRMIRSNFISN